MHSIGSLPPSSTDLPMGKKKRRRRTAKILRGWWKHDYVRPRCITLPFSSPDTPRSARVDRHNGILRVIGFAQGRLDGNRDGFLVEVHGIYGVSFFFCFFFFFFFFNSIPWNWRWSRPEKERWMPKVDAPIWKNRRRRRSWFQVERFWSSGLELSKLLSYVYFIHNVNS